MRKSNDLDRKILNLIDCKNEEVLQENSNKNPTINSTQRDYIAGEYSKDISNRLLLPEDIQKAHNEGLIHFHDMDYFIQKMHNCCLINLEDMLQNGTVISETKIDTPHSFTTACNIATQIIAQVASSQYGGATISLAHLAPFVDVSRKKIINNIKEELEISGAALTEEQIKEIAEERLKREIKSGIQTIQYQIVTLMTTNGQAPFITESMYLNEAKNEQEKQKALKNKPERRRMLLLFMLSFLVLLVGIGSAGAFTLLTAQRGVALLEQKSSAYDRVLQKQAEMNFQLEELFKDLHSLRTKSRTSSEYKYMQKRITQNRMLMEEELSMMNEEERKPYVIYTEILEVVKATQGELDELDAVRRDRLYNMDQLEKCRKKYQELSKSKNGKN